MAIQYYMRGYNTVAHTGAPVGYVDWVVNDIPDSTATFVTTVNANYVPAEISNITVNRTVTSKVDNFLKPFESLTAIGGTGYDGYFFHLNSYDWLHATPPGPPIPVPSYKVGLSVVRGSLTGAIPRDYATLFWAEDALKWLFAYNSNGDGYTIGSALPVGMGNLSIDGYLEVGTAPAQSGIIRIPNNQFIVSRTVAGNNDGYLIGLDNVNRIRLGRSSDGYQTYIPTNLRVDGYVRDGGTSALSGFIRNSNNTPIAAFRNAANSNDITALSSTAGNLVVLGDTINSGVRFNTATGFEHIFQVNSANLFRIGNVGGTTTYANFENLSPNPTVSQFDATIGNGQNLTFKAQNTTSVGGIGGSTIISSGHGLSADGYIDLKINNTPKIRIFGSTVPATPDFISNDGYNPDSIQLFNPNVRFYSDIRKTPDGYYSSGISDGYYVEITQDPINGVDGYALLVLAQSAVSSILKGGDLKLSSGRNNNHSKDGYVRLQTGQVDRLLLDATPATLRATLTLNTFAFNGIDGTFDAASVTSPIIKQRDDVTASITGQLMTIQAQNAPTGINTIGGSLNITSGHGTRPVFEGDGYVRLQTGGTTRLLLDGYNNQASLTLNKFSFNGVDGYSDQFNVINPTIKQRDYVTNGVTANNLTIQSQNATGVNTIGGNLIFKSGIGTTLVPVGASVNSPYLRNGHIFFEAGNITSSVGEFGVDGYGPYFSSGGTTSSAAAIDGYFRVPNNTVALSAARAIPSPPNASIHLLKTDNTDRIIIGETNDFVYIPSSLRVDGYIRDAGISPATSGFIRNSNNTSIITFRNALDSSNVTALSSTSGNVIVLGDAVNSGFIFNTTPNSVYDFRINSVSNKVIIGDGHVRFGVLPASDGYIRASQTASVDTTVVASRNILNTLDLKLLGTDGYDRITHGISASNKGQIFNTADGYSVDGYGYDFRVNAVSSVAIDGYKLSFKTGRRRHITSVSNTYGVLLTDDYLAVNASSIYTITLPSSPTLGDTYEFKDINGTASINNITINTLGGLNIDGASTLVMNTNFASFVVTYTGTQWSVS